MEEEVMQIDKRKPFTKADVLCYEKLLALPQYVGKGKVKFSRKEVYDKIFNPSSSVINFGDASYTLGAKLGRGKGGKAKKSQKIRINGLEKSYVIKVVHLEAGYDEGKKMLIREAKIAALQYADFSDPKECAENIVCRIASGESIYYLVAPYLGQNLTEYFSEESEGDKHTMSDLQMVDFSIRISERVKRLHDLGYVHTR